MSKYKCTVELEIDEEANIEYLEHSLACLVDEWVESQEENGVGYKNWTGNFYKLGE